MALLAASLIGCASHPDKIDAAYVSTLKYEPYSCAQIAIEIEAVEQRTDALYQALRRTRRADNWQAGVGLLLLPTLFALEGGDGPVASEYAFLKGDYEALRHASLLKQCGMQSRSPDEQIEDSLTQDTLIALPNNMRVSLSQMIGMLERAYSQGVISLEELIQAQDTAFRLLGSNTQQPSPEALDSLYAIINKTDLGILARVENPIQAPANRTLPPQLSPAQPAIAENTQRPVAAEGARAPDAIPANNPLSTRAVVESHPSVVQAQTGSVRSMLLEYRHLKGLYVEELPQWKLIHFFEKAGLRSDTTVLGFIDTSVFRSGKNGVLFSEEGIYYTNDFVAGAGGTYFMSYTDVVLHAAPIHRRRYFYLGYETLPQRGLIDFVGADTDLEEFSALILAIKERYETPSAYPVEDDEPRFLFDAAF